MAVLRSIAMMLAVVVLLLRSSQAVLGSYEGVLKCEELTKKECAFAVSSAGARCVLEKSTLPNGDILPSCQTSAVIAERPGVWIESNECIQSCGLERETYGLSTDSLVEWGFRDKLCSSECQNHCPNIMDIYQNLVAGEGAYLPSLCHEHRFTARRLIDSERKAARDTSLASSATPSSLPFSTYGVLPVPAKTPPASGAPSPTPRPSP